jgi:hypothetical protein
LLPYVSRIGGALLILVGLYVGYYGVYELRLFFGGGDARDPVIAAAGAIQQSLAGFVDGIGVVPLLAVLTLVVLGAVLLGNRVKNKSRRRPSGGPRT